MKPNYNVQDIMKKADKFFQDIKRDNDCPALFEETRRLKDEKGYKTVDSQVFLEEKPDPATFEGKFFNRCIFIGDFTGFEPKNCIFNLCYFSGYVQDLIENPIETVLFFNAFFDVTG